MSMYFLPYQFQRNVLSCLTVIILNFQIKKVGKASTEEINQDNKR